MQFDRKSQINCHTFQTQFDCCYQIEGISRGNCANKKTNSECFYKMEFDVLHDKMIC